jgi:hypothetical protein
MLDLLLLEWVTKVKPGSNSVEDYPQLSHNGHPVDGAQVGAGSLWPEILLNISIKCWNSGLNARDSKIFITAVHTPTSVIG